MINKYSDKKPITLAAFMFLKKEASAQINDSGGIFSYDATGNCTKRKLCFNEVPIEGLVSKASNRKL